MNKKKTAIIAVVTLVILVTGFVALLFSDTTLGWRLEQIVRSVILNDSPYAPGCDAC